MLEKNQLENEGEKYSYTYFWKNGEVYECIKEY